jgi:hypothetical protein
MTDNSDKGFFDRLGELLNTPLPGTQGSHPADTDPAPAATDDEAGLLAHIRDILNAPLPGTARAGDADGSVQPSRPAVSNAPITRPGEHAPQTSAPPGPVIGSAVEPAGAPDGGGQMEPPAPDLAEDALAEDWWQGDWDTFKAHQAQEARGLEIKQSQDRNKFAAFQEQERQRFAAHQGQEEGSRLAPSRDRPGICPIERSASCKTKLIGCATIVLSLDFRFAGTPRNAPQRSRSQTA